ncbi:hypothetical protein VTJ83DRAFT_5394 [Remersonia thermophila]|uniref:Steroid 5-alpha reductase C-terminal domain-containing protein n=1 Tax=Remersonia thermophila TaxID=72144 RepID=A0ABR4D8X3_9PEZI
MSIKGPETRRSRSNPTAAPPQDQHSNRDHSKPATNMFIYVIGPLLPIFVSLLLSATRMFFHILRAVILPAALPFLFTKAASSVPLLRFFPALFFSNLTRCFLMAIVWNFSCAVLLAGIDSGAKNSGRDIGGVMAFGTAVACSVSRIVFTYISARNVVRMATAHIRDPRLLSTPGRLKTISPRLMCQAGWILACAMPTLALNTLPADAFPRISARWDYAYVLRMSWFWLGMWIYLRGLYFETLADWQMLRWRYDKWRGRHGEAFCSRGLWAGCRHPNYYGECLVWLGLSMACSAVLISKASREVLNLSWFTVVIICATPPVFVYYTLRYLSIPAIEAKYDKVYMHRKDYKRWRRANTLRLWLDQDWENPVAQDPEGFDFETSAKIWLYERGIDFNATIGEQELKRQLKQFLLDHLEEIIASNPDAAADKMDIEEARKWLDEHFDEIFMEHPDDADEETMENNADGSLSSGKSEKAESGGNAGSERPAEVALRAREADCMQPCKGCR